VTCSKCDRPALKRSKSENVLCSVHRRAELRAQEAVGDCGPTLTTLSHKEWCLARGWDPETRTYIRDDIDPIGRPDMNWMDW
jgi:hypothetical protein